MHSLRLTACLLASIVLCLVIVQPPASACTAFQLRSKDGAIIYFRSMEFGVPFNSSLLVVPRGTEYVGTAPEGKPGMRWSTTYGFVGMNVDVAPTIVADGMNEKGLAIGMLYLPGYAKYLAPDASANDRTIGGWEAATFLLSTCASVDDAVSALRSKVRVVEQSFPAFGMALPLHYWIGDASGRVVIVEYVGGEMKVYENPLGSLTNSPPFDWQQINLSNYVNLSPVNVPSESLGGVEVQNFGQGSGMLGLPGDFTPASRFVRATLFSQWAKQAPTALETVNLGVHVLNTFDIFEGAVQGTEGLPPMLSKPGALPATPAVHPTDTTEWLIAHDRTNLKTYVRMYGGLECQAIDLTKLDFSKPGSRVIKLKTEFRPVDVTDTAETLR